VAVPFPAVRHTTYWLDRPQPAPGWGRFFESLGITRKVVENIIITAFSAARIGKP